MNKNIKFILSLLFCILLFNQYAFATTYTYDNLHRLTKVEYSDGRWIKYSYDDAGNIKTVTTSITNRQPGDINGDSDITISDAVLALKISMGDTKDLDGQGYKYADVNGDGVIGTEEVIYILSYLSE